MQDDLLIKQEGIESLTDDELRSACKVRGMKAAFGPGATMYMRNHLQVSIPSFGGREECECLDLGE